MIGAVIQVWILMLVIHIRTGTLYQVMFLTATFGLTILWYWKHNPKIGRYVLNKVRIWPLAIVFVGFFIFKMYLLLNLNESYTDVRSRHLFWTAVHRGISAHPDKINKYGIKYECDACSHHLVAKITYERYGTKDWEALGGVRIVRIYS